MSEVELIEFGELPEGFDFEACYSFMREMVVRAFLIPAVIPCRICVLADATGDDDLCDTCRAAVISRKSTYTPPQAGDLQRKAK